MEQGEVALIVMGIILVICFVANRVQQRRMERETYQVAAETR